MCGRYSLSKNSGYDVPIGAFVVRIIFNRRFNVAPTQSMPVIVTENGVPVVREMKWGLVPSWSQESKSGFKLVNAKAETLNLKTHWKRLLRSQRCLVPADGFYEWERAGRKKLPWHFSMKDHEPFCFAGLWDKWSDAQQELETYTIITVPANPLVGRIHNRMPAILARDHYVRWLIAGVDDCLRPFPETEMEAGKANPLVNNVKNETEDCLKPVPTETTGELFVLE